MVTFPRRSNFPATLAFLEIFLQQAEANRDHKAKVYNRDYYLFHKKEKLKQVQEWKRDNPEASKEYYAKNKEKIKARSAEWRKNNPEGVKKQSNSFVAKRKALTSLAKCTQ